MKNELTADEKKVQKLINKLVSEEVIAHDLYLGCVVAADSRQRKLFNDLFVELAEDELFDHCKKLNEYALSVEMAVPFKYKDYEKHADEKLFKLFNSLKSDEDAKYYIQIAIDAEILAIQSYEEALRSDYIPYELTAILTNIYYDEIEHLNSLQTLILGYDAGTYIITC